MSPSGAGCAGRPTGSRATPTPCSASRAALRSAASAAELYFTRDTRRRHKQAGREYQGAQRAYRQRQRQARAGVGKRLAPTGVSKTLYQREKRTSPYRSAELAAGTGLASDGVGNSRMLGHGLEIGRKFSRYNENANAAQAFEMAQRIQGALKRGTRPHGPGPASGPTDRPAGPEGLRPSIRSLRSPPSPGAFLMGNSQPIRRTHYRPVTQPIPVRPTRW